MNGDGGQGWIAASEPQQGVSSGEPPVEAAFAPPRPEGFGEPSAEDDPYADMPPKMRKFFKREPRHLSEEAIAARANKCIRRGGRPRGWLEECCEAQHWRCYYCTRSMRRKPRKDKPWLTATLDHMTPISRGGRNQRWNLVAACYGCNQAKGAQTAEEFIAARASDGNPKGEKPQALSGEAMTARSRSDAPE